MGLGVNEYAFDWWDSLYNKTATNLSTANLLTESTSPSNTSIITSKKDTSNLYCNFQTSQPLLQKDYSIRLTDKELFEACGKRSGNQRARLKVMQDEDEENIENEIKVKLEAESLLDGKRKIHEQSKIKETKEEKKKRRLERQTRKIERVLKRNRRIEKRDIKLNQIRLE